MKVSIKKQTKKKKTRLTTFHNYYFIQRFGVPPSSGMTFINGHDVTSKNINIYEIIWRKKHCFAEK